MAESVVYASVLASALASLRTLRTSVVAFDTNVVDLTQSLTDPVDVFEVREEDGELRVLITEE